MIGTHRYQYDYIILVHYHRGGIILSIDWIIVDHLVLYLGNSVRSAPIYCSHMINHYND